MSGGAATAPGRALVTGASSGIGAAVARELARRGHRLVLVARDGERLEEVARGLGPGRHPLVLARDLTEDGALDDVVARVRADGAPLDVLVNAAGFAVHGAFASSDVGPALRLLELQVAGLVRLTGELLPDMLARGRGRILNVASVYSFFPVAWQAVYGACKAFMLSFSEALAEELRASGVSVTAVCPGTTRTRFRTRAGLGGPRAAEGMDAERVAARACRALFRGRPLVVPGAGNRAYVAGARLLPRRVFAALLRRVNARRGLGAAR